MTNRTKILIVIICAVIIGIIGIVIINIKNKDENQEEDQINEMLEYFNDTNNTNEENNVIENDIEENVIIRNEATNNQTQNNKTAVVGREEQESNKENTSTNNEQKAIEMAKQEWGISVDSYNFQAELQNDGTYKVTVRNNDSNRTAVAIYIINVQANTVKDITE